MSQVRIEKLFHEARTHNEWLNKPVSDDLLKQIYDIMKWAPTSANSSPGRFVFVRPGAAKDKLLGAMAPGNVEKTKSAPVTAIFAHDSAFFEKLPKLFPQTDAKSWFSGNPALAEATAVHNAVLQEAYFILAARAVGLDCGPMAGFDKEKVDAAFFAGTTWRSDLVCNLGYGDKAKLFPRNPRLDFAEACRIVT